VSGTQRHSYAPPEGRHAPQERRCGVAILGCAALVAALTALWPAVPPHAGSQPAETPGPVSFSLVPATLTLRPGRPGRILVTVSAPAQPVSAVAIYLQYDPSLLRITDGAGQEISTLRPHQPSPFDQVLQNGVSAALGTIDYAAGTTGPPPSGTFEVAAFYVTLLRAEPASLTWSTTAPRQSEAAYGGQPLLGRTAGAVIQPAHEEPEASVTLTTAPPQTPTSTRTPTPTRTPIPTRTPTPTRTPVPPPAPSEPLRTAPPPAPAVPAPAPSAPVGGSAPSGHPAGDRAGPAPAGTRSPGNDPPAWLTDLPSSPEQQPLLRHLTDAPPRRSRPLAVRTGEPIDPFPPPDAEGLVRSPVSPLVELVWPDSSITPLGPAQAVTLHVRYDPATLPPGASEDWLVLARLDRSAPAPGWRAVDGAAVDQAARVVTVRLREPGVYAVMAAAPAERETIPGQQVYYAVTDQYVSFGILEAYRLAGGPAVCGYPRTGEGVEGGVTVQWFQRCRAEWHPELDGQVLFGLLGDEFLQARRLHPDLPLPDAGALVPVQAPSAGIEDEAVMFGQTGTSTSGPFRLAMETLGVDLTGYPATDEFVEAGVRVQYFQRMRMEWRPELGGVVLGNLGDSLLVLHGRL
jgi:hypothetical protein